ncbi:protein ACCELERATED CELL DEATH 6-like [Prosopis cineraria]|uniref:protein ACCELERATED CELL DEATH 6-like n=1 Tax=Prosopis cineraria TaxID=364024 RepID=UPI00240F594E|nr:protein ACCELERATED CELL DEATH 6-like [Prosopis cineraria]
MSKYSSPLFAFQQNLDGNLPIHLDCEKGHVQVVKELLEIRWSDAGFCLNNEGQNILHVAAIKGHTNVIKYLLENPKIHPHAVNQRDLYGDTPRHLASKNLHLWTLLLLPQDKKINANLVNNEGLTSRDVVRMRCKTPMTRQKFLADVILRRAGMLLKKNMLGVPRELSGNEDWKVKDADATLILVAVLIATVTFAAGFTVPGGFYSSDDPITKQRGLALLTHQTLFKVFTVLNTIAMYSSTIGSTILLWVPLGDLRFAERAYGLAKILVYVALITMPVAFVAATRLVISNNTLLADVISVIGFISIFFIIFVRILGRFPLGSRPPIFRQLGDFFIWIILILFYGSNDIFVEEDGEIDRESQDDEANQINLVRKYYSPLSRFVAFHLPRSGLPLSALRA